MKKISTYLLLTTLIIGSIPQVSLAAEPSAANDFNYVDAFVLCNQLKFW